MTVARRPLVLTAALATAWAAVALPALARSKDRTISIARIPSWVREAAARAAPASDGDLVWLHDEETVEPLAGGGVRIAHRVAARVLKSSGLDRLDRWSVDYRRGDEITVLAAWSIEPDGSARASHPKDDVEDGPLISSLSVFEDGRVRSIGAPAARVGSVIAFEDERVEQLDVGAERFVFGDTNRTTVYSRFTLKVPAGWSRESLAERTEGIDREEAADSLIFTAHDLLPLPQEEYRPPASEILPAVWARWWSPDGKRGYRDWDAVGRWYEDLAGGVLKEAGEAAQIAERSKPVESGGLLDSIAKVFAFAAREVRYVSIQIGIGGYKPHTPAQVCANRFGDCKDKTFLMRAVAGSWGLRTYPVLVSTREHGRVAGRVPTPLQFNHCIAAVELPPGVGKDLWTAMEIEGIGRVVFLDATVREGSPWDLHDEVQGTTALLVHPGGAKLVKLPVPPPEAVTIGRTLTAQVDEAGRMSAATLIETRRGAAGETRRSQCIGETDEQRRQTIRDRLQDRFPGASVAEYRIEGLDRTDAPIVETTTLTGGRFGKKVGDLLIVEPGRGAYGVVETGLPPPPRRWRLDLVRPKEEIAEVTVSVPSGWVPEELPAPSAVETPDLVSRSEWRIEEGRLVYRRTERLLATEVPAERYPAFRDAVRRVQADDARAIVFIRK